VSKALVELTIGGRKYRLNATTDAQTLQRLVQLIEDKLGELSPSQRTHPQAFLLVALALAYELDVERQHAGNSREHTAARLRQLVSRIDSALQHVDENGDPLPSLL
jgi:cell division protein ZapA (FtsZ GTPase activity inhibitor)